MKRGRTEGRRLLLPVCLSSLLSSLFSQLLSLCLCQCVCTSDTGSLFESIIFTPLVSLFLLVFSSSLPHNSTRLAGRAIVCLSASCVADPKSLARLSRSCRGRCVRASACLVSCCSCSCHTGAAAVAFDPRPSSPSLSPHTECVCEARKAVVKKKTEAQGPVGRQGRMDTLARLS